VVVLSYFLGGWDTPNPPKNKKNPPIIFYFALVQAAAGCPLFFFIPAFILNERIATFSH